MPSRSRSPKPRNGSSSARTGGQEPVQGSGLPPNAEPLEGHAGFFARLFRHAALGVAINSLEGRFEYCNPAYSALVGYSEEQLRRMNLRDLIHPEDRKDNLAQIRRLLKQEVPFYDIENRYVHNNGDTVWVRKFGSVLPDAEGKPAHLTVLALPVGDRRRAEMALRKSEEMLRLFVGYVPAGIAMFDRDMRYLAASCRWISDYRIQSDIIGRSHYDVFPEIPGQWKQIHQRGLAGESARSEGDRLVRQDGSVQWVKWDVLPWYTSSGQVGGILIAEEDITRRKQAELSALESQEKLAAEAAALARLNEDVARLWLTSDLNEGLHLMLDSVMKLLGADKGIVQILDASQQVLNVSVQRGFPEDVLASFQEISAKDSSPSGLALRSGQRVLVEDVDSDVRLAPLLPMARAAGIRSAQSTPIRARDGSLLGMISTHFSAPRQFTGQELAWLDLYVNQLAVFLDRHITERRLQRSREQAQLALRAAGAAAWTWDSATGQSDWDDRFRLAYGFPLGHPASHDDWINRIHPDDRPRILSRMGELLANPGDDEWQMEFRAVLPGGRVVWMEGLGSAERDAAGVVQRISGINLDITARKLIEQERDQADRRMNDFLAILGHELRNPLAALSTVAQILPDTASGPGGAPLNELIGRQVHVLTRLVDDLLDSARIKSGHLDLRLEVTDLKRCLDDAFAIMRQLISERSHRVQISFPAKPVYIQGDPVRLEQVFVNLLSNAAKYTPPGGHIELSLHEEDGHAVVRCKDNGMGIAPELQDSIFGFFVQGDPPSGSAQQGLGIGLGVARRLVEMQAGSISVHSEGAGKGSVFTVRLPLAEPSPAPSLAPVQPAVRPQWNKFNVAIVEDNPDLALGLSALLQTAGHQVQSFADCKSALAGLSRRNLDAVIIDIGLPGGTGHALASRLRRRKNLRHATFIAMSASSRERDKAFAQFDHFLLKPFDTGRLLGLIEAHARLASGHPDGATARAVGKPVPVLLVEDNVPLAEVTSQFLRKNGCEVSIAHSGEDALLMASSVNPQIILCDLSLPGMRGTHLAAELRKSPATRGAVIAILTARSDAELEPYREQASRLGVDLFLSKPLTDERLRKVLAKHRSRITS